MDIAKLLKNIHNLNEYISTTQDASEKCKSSKIQLNMSSVLALKKIRSLEIEYFNKCEDNGIACIIFERLLSLPPSKTWGVLSKELVNLLQYWLDAVRKHLVRHSSHWWTFLKLLLKFVKEIYQKDSSLPNILVEDTAECLLDLATNSRPDPTQRYEILHCFNMYCSESSREIRFALRNRLAQYFKKLSTYMANCGHLPTQYSIMETLLRWLLPRQDRNLRIASAAKWFPTALYEDHDISIFLERPWINFFQDARDFLNAHNQRHDLITSVVCRKLNVGDIVIISDTDRQESWLDINASTKCLSVLLDPRALETFGSTNHKSFETLYITYDNTQSVKLYRESQQIIVSMQTAAPPRILPSCVELGNDVSCDVTAVVSTRSDVTKLHLALRKVFEDKYQMLLDLDKDLDLSPIPRTDNSKQNNQEDVRFSHPVEVKRRKHSGYIVHSRQAVSSCMSPSTASTSSLAQLHEKLAALPRYRFDKEPVSVCAAPDLSIVTELSEADDRQSLISTQLVKNKPYGVCYRNLQKDDRKSQSDPETSTKVRKARGLSPCVNEATTSCLLVATIGSADDSVINDTLERITKSKDYSGDNIVDLLVKEALQSKYDEKTDSGINTGEKKAYLSENSEAIENTPNADEVKIAKVKKSKVVTPTSDESNTDAINETPCFVSSRKKKKETKEPQRSTFDEEVVEQFFNQHFTENKHGEVIISPTLAKKINETSSETSDDFEDNFQLIPEEDINCDFNELEVLECLNNMVDRVCDEFDKCTIYLSKDNEVGKRTAGVALENNPVLDIINTINTIQDNETKSKENKPDSKKKNKLKYKVPKKAKPRATKKKNKLELEPAFKMSTIIEDDGAEETMIKESEKTNTNKNIPLEPEVIVIVPQEQKQKEVRNKNVREKCNENENLQEECIEKCVNENLELECIEKDQETKEPEKEMLKTPPLRRKRKLYSPKDGNMGEVSIVNEEDIAVSETKIKKTPKSTATCYKELEKERQKRIRKPRSRNKKEPPSPRTQKFNDMFDKLKETTNGEKVRLVDKAEDIYNFTSDSDDDFKVIVKTSKKNSTTTVASIESAISKHGRAFKRINYTDKVSSDESNPKRKVRRPRTKKKSQKEEEEHKIQKEPEQRDDLVDERMRKADDVLNTSIVVEKTYHRKEENVTEFVPEKAPEMELIEDKRNNKQINEAKKKGNKKIKTEVTDTKKSKRLQSKVADKIDSNADDDRTQSPLPGLLVEPVTANQDDANDISLTMADKFKKFYQEGPDKYINDTNTTHNLLSDVERVNFSQPDIEMNEELIHIEEQAQHKDISSETSKEKVNKTKKANNDKSRNKKGKNSNATENESNERIKVIHIRDSSVVQSIATDGITGHGESDEAPPNPKLINEIFEPRNLEVQDLDESAKDYFDKLTKVMNDSDNKDSSDSSRKKLKSATAKSASPVVSLHRMSFEDISRWLPSRRNTESDASSVSSISEKENNKERAHKIIESPTKKSDEGTPRKSWIMWQKLNQLSKIDSSKSKDNNSDTENNYLVKLRNKNNQSPVFTKSRNKKSPTITKNRNNQSPIFTRSKSKVTKPKVKRLSKNISPIKLFEDLDSVADTQTEKSISEEGSIVQIVHKLTKNTKKYKPERTLRKNVREISVPKSIESVSSKMSTSTKKEQSRTILKRISEEERGVKKKRMEVNNNVDIPSGSGLTVSSVDDWFKRIEPDTSRSETRHVLQNVMEKLDTTLSEIHRNTSKQFVHLFVDTQKHLNDLEEERRGLYKKMAADIIRDIIKVIDEKFTDLDKRSQELDSNFMKRLKERTSELIREDCKQKRVMVQLLKEDVQAVLDHVERYGYK